MQILYFSADMKRFLLPICTFLSILFLACSCADNKEVEHFSIKRGINIAHWLSQSGERGAARDSFFTDKDIRYIASLGFDHVRIPIDEEQMFAENGQKEPKAFELLHRAIQGCIDNGLRVVVDLHILRSHHFNAAEKPLFTQRSAQEAFYECWRQISGELSCYSVAWVAYELMNEPVADDPEDWNKIVNECYCAVRELEPERIIAIGSNRWQSFDTVKDLRVPEGDPNIIISFHYYNPFLLTHYEASWTSQRDYHGPVHYPGVPVTKEELDSCCSEEVLPAVQWFSSQYYDAEKLRRDFQDAVDVAARYHLPVYCGEYGCMKNPPLEDRMAWHRDMEAVFDSMGIARAMWCYRESDEGFGILMGQRPDEQLIHTIGLK